jgi:hypothetical protein
VPLTAGWHQHYHPTPLQLQLHATLQSFRRRDRKRAAHSGGGGGGGALSRSAAGMRGYMDSANEALLTSCWQARETLDKRTIYCPWALLDNLQMKLKRTIIRQPSYN